MTTEEIISQLAYNKGVFPRQAVEEAVRQREEITPELLGVLGEAAENLEHIASQEDYFGHIFALYLLAQFRESRAYPLMVEFFSADRKLLEEALGDVLTEDLGRMLASVCGGDIDPICRMIENSNLDEYVRGAALKSLVVLVVQGTKSREEVVDYFRTLFRGKLEHEAGFVWNSLVGRCCDLYPGELVEDIRRAFGYGLVETLFISPQNVERKLAEGEDAALAGLAQDPGHRLIDDTVQEISDWYCFRDSDVSAKAPKEPAWVVAPIRTEPKVGRNAPCPCGSGKKYKKCCLE